MALLLALWDGLGHMGMVHHTVPVKPGFVTQCITPAGYPVVQVPVWMVWVKSPLSMRHCWVHFVPDTERDVCETKPEQFRLGVPRRHKLRIGHQIWNPDSTLLPELYSEIIVGHILAAVNPQQVVDPLDQIWTDMDALRLNHDIGPEPFQNLRGKLVVMLDQNDRRFGSKNSI